MCRIDYLTPRENWKNFSLSQPSGLINEFMQFEIYSKLNKVSLSPHVLTSKALLRSTQTVEASIYMTVSHSPKDPKHIH